VRCLDRFPAAVGLFGRSSGGKNLLRDNHRKRVLTLLQDHGALTRSDLVRRSGISRATISSVVAALVDEGYLREIDPPNVDRQGRAGRPSSLLTLDPSGGAAVGIDVDHDCLRVVVADLSHTVLAEADRPLELDHDAETAMALAADLAHLVVNQAGIRPDQVVGVGMALAGPLERATGRPNPSSISPSWVGIDAASAMERHIGYPVHIDNDANLGALAESMWGAGRGVSEAAYVKVDTGVGAALILGGQIYRGAVGTAGEIGHSTVAEDGPVCRCGNRGCLERFVGAPALLESLRGSHGDLAMHDMLRLAEAGDTGCRRVIQDAGRLIGVQLANLCNLLNPHRVIIGGALSAAGDLLLDPIRASLERCALPMAAATAEVVPGELGERATVLGALSLVFRKVDPFELRPRAVSGTRADAKPATKAALPAAEDEGPVLVPRGEMIG
jgi:predicted NBD/HSP70 family sugar kinase